jgi:hypothetical protein
MRAISIDCEGNHMKRGDRFKVTFDYDDHFGESGTVHYIFGASSCWDTTNDFVAMLDSGKEIVLEAGHVTIMRTEE